MRKFLIYTSAGDHNNVSRWLSSDNRSYDVWVTNYSDTQEKLKDSADYYNQRKGAKFPNFKFVVENYREQIAQYEAIMVADDDIIISPKKLDRLFAQLVSQDLWVITPAYSRIGKITHDTTERKLTTRYRYTNFAEVTCPIFKTDKLLEFIDVYNADLPCYGVDWWYLNVLNDQSEKKIVISDENWCINPRDIHKSTGVREIEKFMKKDDREKKWKDYKDALDIDSFEKKTFLKVRESFLKVIVRIPGYVIEVLFDSLLKSKHSRGAKRLVKRLVALRKSARTKK